MTQLRLDMVARRVPESSPRARLAALLHENLDFHDESSNYASHNFHSFPAKFPPQLPRKFILGMTQPGDIVLDPMVGSGTTLVEALMTGRRAIGLDIDPLALLLTSVKTAAIDAELAVREGMCVLDAARDALCTRPGDIESALKSKWAPASRRFIDYWFARETQMELAAMVLQIEALPPSAIRSFLELTARKWCTPPKGMSF